MTAQARAKAEPERECLMIGAERCAGAAGRYIESLNPATGEVLVLLVRGTAEDVDRAVDAARTAFESKRWRELAPADRGRLLYRMAELIRNRAEELARVECLDTGKPLSQARSDIAAGARYFEYYGGMADKVMGKVIPVRWGTLELSTREPYGVSAQIVPWNFPFMLAARGIAPALAAGNCVVVKPAEDASLSVLRLAELALEAGFPGGALNVVTGLGSEAGAALAAHRGISHLTFTGSVATGTSVMKAAADNVVPVSLELGGKSPNVVFADADLEAVLPAVTRAIILNAGQVCNAGSRLLLQSSIHDRVMEALSARFAKVRLGRPLDDPDLGPLASERQRERVQGYLKIAKEEGAEVHSLSSLPGEADLKGGFFTLPTLLDRVVESHRVFGEEIFGPVLAVSTFDDAEEAIHLANATEYGLVAGIWTRDVSRALYLASSIRAGQVYINAFGAAGSVETPFGGYKKSGFGREKGEEGLLHYTQVKSISARFA